MQEHLINRQPDHGGPHLLIGDRVRAKSDLRAQPHNPVVEWLRDLFKIPLIKKGGSVGSVTNYLIFPVWTSNINLSEDVVHIAWDDGSSGIYFVKDVSPLGLLERIADASI